MTILKTIAVSSILIASTLVLYKITQAHPWQTTWIESCIIAAGILDHTYIKLTEAQVHLQNGTN